MTFSEKIGYKIGNAVIKFKRWNVSVWLKITLILVSFILLSYLLYQFFQTGLAIIVGIVFFLCYIPKPHNQYDETQDDEGEDESDGYRDGHSGFGFYYGDTLVRHDEDDEVTNRWGEL